MTETATSEEAKKSKKYSKFIKYMKEVERQDELDEVGKRKRQWIIRERGIPVAALDTQKEAEDYVKSRKEEEEKKSADDKNEDKNPSNYDGFMSYMDEVHEVWKLIEQKKDDRAEVREEAEKALRAYAYPHVSEEIRNSMSAEDLDDKTVEGGVAAGRLKAMSMAANGFYFNLDSIVDEQMPAKSLEALVQAKEINERAEGKQKIVLEAYNSWKIMEGLKKRFENKEALSDEEKKYMIGAIARGAGEAEAENLRKQGYDNRAQAAGRALAQMAMQYGIQSGYIGTDEHGDYALEGLKTIAESAKKNYENISKKLGKAEDIGREILKKMAENRESREEFGRAQELVYFVGRDEYKKSHNLVYLGRRNGLVKEKDEKDSEDDLREAA